MAARELPMRLDHRRAAVTESRFYVCLTVGELARLAEISTAGRRDAGVVEASLSFFEDDTRWARVSGRVEYRLSLACSRCLQPVNVAGATAVDGVLVNDDDQAARAPRRFEPTVVGADGLDSRAFIVDEVLLALPQVIQCSRATCRAQFDSAPIGDDDERDDDRWRPFAGLRD